MSRWLLPQGIEDVLPERAAVIEGLRRRILDLYDLWGYVPVSPPEVEFLDSLLTGVGADLSLQTLKVVDQLSGRLMGFRADMTPQVARIDASRLHGEGPRRLCYAGPVLRACPEGFGRSRAPLQVGAEIFGVAGPHADAEVIGLMAATLREVGIQDFRLDMGHVGLYCALVNEIGLESDRESELFQAVQRKDVGAVTWILQGSSTPKAYRQALRVLPTLHGGPEVLEAAQVCAVNPNAQVALGQFEELMNHLRYRGLEEYSGIDLGELRGYDYHTGPVFSAFVVGQGEAVLSGGRYDGIGAAFGRARAATGISGDLKLLAEFSPMAPISKRGIVAPASGPAGLYHAIDQVRVQGRQVVQALEEVDPTKLREWACAQGYFGILVYDPWEGWSTEPVGEEIEDEAQGSGQGA